MNFIEFRVDGSSLREARGRQVEVSGGSDGARWSADRAMNEILLFNPEFIVSIAFTGATWRGREEEMRDEREGGGRREMLVDYGERERRMEDKNGQRKGVRGKERSWENRGLFERGIKV